MNVLFGPASLLLMHATRAVFGYPDALLETIEVTNVNNSACYGTHTDFRPSCAHGSGTVIGVQAVNIGAKLRSLQCTYTVSDVDTRNDTCCTPNTAEDCIRDFKYTNSGVDYKFHKLCSGFSECLEPAQVTRDYNNCDNTTTNDYMEWTNYMFMEYACIEVSRIGGLCTNQSYTASGTGAPYYLQTPNYTSGGISADISTCSCYVQASADIHVYTLDMRLESSNGSCGQTLNVSDETSSNIYTCSSATVFNVTDTIKAKDVWITLDNRLGSNGGYIWIGLAGISIGIIIGVVIGLLLLIALIMAWLCYCLKRKKQKKMPETEDSGRANVIPVISHNSMNTRFQTTNIPTNKVVPTRYIEEHGGINVCLQRGQHLPPISHAGDVTNAGYQPGDVSKTLNIPHTGAIHLLPIASPREVNVNNTDDTVQANAIATAPSEHKHKKKRKHKKHKHNKRESINPTGLGMDQNTKPMAEIVDSEIANAEQDEERKQRRDKKRKHRNRIAQMPHNDNLMNDNKEKLIDDTETTV